MSSVLNKPVSPLWLVALVLFPLLAVGGWMLKVNRDTRNEESRREFDRRIAESLKPGERALRDAKVELYSACLESRSRGLTLSDACQEAIAEHDKNDGTTSTAAVPEP